MSWMRAAFAAVAMIALSPLAQAADWAPGAPPPPAPQTWGLQQDYDPSAGYYREGAVEYRAWRGTFQRLPEYGEYQYWLRRDQVYLPGQLIPGNPVPGPAVPAATYGYYDADGYQYFDEFEDPRAPVAGPGVGDRQAWLDYCRSKYRSFNPATGMYRTYSGEYRPCRY